jgi:hypothetical protein
MSFAKPDFSGQKAAKPEVDVTRCKAYGCKLRATVSTDGHGFCCGVHAFAVSDQWPDITRRLSENDWLVGLIDEVQRMDQRCQDWRGFANQFWENSDTACQPHPLENAIPYQNRMRGELLHRVGQLARRPQVRLPKNVQAAGQFAQQAAV